MHLYNGFFAYCANSSGYRLYLQMYYNSSLEVKIQFYIPVLKQYCSDRYSNYIALELISVIYGQIAPLHNSFTNIISQETSSLKHLNADYYVC